MLAPKSHIKPLGADELLELIVVAEKLADEAPGITLSFRTLTHLNPPEFKSL